MNPMVTANQKPTIHTHTHKRKDQKLTSRESHQTTREETKKRKDEQRNTTKTTRKPVVKWQ